MISSWQGIVIGVSIAAPIGPMAILCLRRCFIFGRSVGLATGMGVASAHLLYSAVAVVGLQSVSTLLNAHSGVVRAAGAAVMIGLGVRTAWASPSSEPGQLCRPTTRAAYLSALGLCLANPLTVLSLAGLFAGLDPTAAEGAPRAVTLVLGVFAGSSLWWLVLTRSAAAIAKRFTGHTLGALNRVSGPSLMAMGASIAFR